MDKRQEVEKRVQKQILLAWIQLVIWSAVVAVNVIVGVKAYRYMFSIGVNLDITTDEQIWAWVSGGLFFVGLIVMILAIVNAVRLNKLTHQAVELIIFSIFPILFVHLIFAYKFKNKVIIWNQQYEDSARQEGN